VTRPVTIRPYAVGDLAACRELWDELTRRHRELYSDPSIGGDDPGGGFDRYLAQTPPARVWVADEGGAVVGLAGLLVEGEKAELEPIVVAGPRRREDIGRRLAETAVATARELGFRQVSVRPVGRNADAIRFFHALGFDVLGRVDLRLDLDERSRVAGERIADRDFRV
jgi:N-acetylglutamate synthase-like GNAT family acetyltransferase